MCDKLVFDLAQEIEATPTVFVRKDWINILDNQNQNYNNNQSVIDTSQLSNSNKYMGYREAYFLVPFTLTLAQTSSFSATAGENIRPATGTTNLDYAVGLKNWFGTIIHSFTLDYNGTTIIQQTPLINMYNSFKLMTSLSIGDVETQGATIGFYPDDATAFAFIPVAGAAASGRGQGVCNNQNFIESGSIVDGSVFNKYRSDRGNVGLLRRQQLINFDADGGGVGTTAVGAYGSLLSGGSIANPSGGNTALTTLWKSYIASKVNGSSGGTNNPALVISITATIYLKHIHSFFNMCPLVKGAFMKMTMNLNNSSVSGKTTDTGALLCTGVSNPFGGVSPLMIAASETNEGGLQLQTTRTADTEFRVNLSVGKSCLDQTINSVIASVQSSMAASIYLYVPSYTFNPVFEQAYLSTPIKAIRYSDVYQYQVLNIPGGTNGGTFNNLLTNGIANIKSVLILPYYSTNGVTATTTAAGVLLNDNTGFVSGIPVWQSPFDPAGAGPTSPLCHITNFNIQISGQNAIYNLQKYNFEQFNNQLYGQNAVNGGLTDGITSSLIDRQSFDMEYCYYYVNVERMLPVEMSVPKSVQILGTNTSSKVIDLICFIEYGQEISIDIMTGARV